MNFTITGYPVDNCSEFEQFVKELKNRGLIKVEDENSNRCDSCWPYETIVLYVDSHIIATADAGDCDMEYVYFKDDRPIKTKNYLAKVIHRHSGESFVEDFCEVYIDLEILERGLKAIVKKEATINKLYCTEQSDTEVYNIAVALLPQAEIEVAKAKREQLGIPVKLPRWIAEIEAAQDDTDRKEFQVVCGAILGKKPSELTTEDSKRLLAMDKPFEKFFSELECSWEEFFRKNPWE